MTGRLVPKTDNRAPIAACPCCHRPLDQPVDVAARIAAAGLTRRQRCLVDRLARQFGHWVAASILIDAVYGEDADGGPLAAEVMLYVHIHHSRRKLAGVALKIDGDRAGSYRLILSPPNPLKG